MIQLAMIPPLAMMDDYVVDSGVNMFLPLLIEGHRTYTKHIWRVNAKSYTILDNGAFEGLQYNSSRLLGVARTNEITEVVVPDVMKDTDRTIQAVGRFTQQTLNRREGFFPKKYMAVVQGKTFTECVRCITEIARYSDFTYITTLGLPKHLLPTTEDKRIRLRLARFIRTNYNGRYDIHFLGGSPHWPSEVGHAWEYGVRSMDTSMPFVYTAAGKVLNDSAEPLERTENYFRLSRDELDEDLLTRNLATLYKWAERGL